MCTRTHGGSRRDAHGTDEHRGGTEHAGGKSYVASYGEGEGKETVMLTLGFAVQTSPTARRKTAARMESRLRKARWKTMMPALLKVRGRRG